MFPVTLELSLRLFEHPQDRLGRWSASNDQASTHGFQPLSLCWEKFLGPKTNLEAREEYFLSSQNPKPQRVGQRGYDQCDLRFFYGWRYKPNPIHFSF